jgi:hypothetical protein
MIIRTFSENSLKDMWLFVLAIILVMLVVDQVE